MAEQFGNPSSYFVSAGILQQPSTIDQELNNHYEMNDNNSSAFIQKASVSYLNAQSQYPTMNHPSVSYPSVSYGYSTFSEPANYNSDYNQAWSFNLNEKMTGPFFDSTNSNLNNDMLKNEEQATDTEKSLIRKSKQSSKTHEIFYCEICRIRCTDLQGYHTHCKGQRHKRRSAANNQQNSNVYAVKCEICDVMCSDAQSYELHIRGKPHGKVVNLLKQRNEISDQTDITSEISETSPNSSNRTSIVGVLNSTFVRGENLTILSKPEETVHDQEERNKQNIEKEAAKQMTNDLTKKNVTQLNDCQITFDNSSNMSENEMIDDSCLVPQLGSDKNVHNFVCIVCACSVLAGCKAQHLAGKRHQNALKKSKLVKKDSKSCLSMTTEANSEIIDSTNNAPETGSNKVFETKTSTFCPPGSKFNLNSLTNDKNLTLKHNQIVPLANELKTTHLSLIRVEKCLRFICSTIIYNRDEQVLAFKESSAPLQSRQMAVMSDIFRVGSVAKALLLRGEKNISLVINCFVKPTVTYMDAIENLLTTELKKDNSNFLKKCEKDLDNACIRLYLSPSDLVLTISFTSPLMRKLNAMNAPQDLEKDPQLVLNTEACLKSLADIRRVKWFYANSLVPSHIIIRLLIDLKKREPVFNKLSNWVIELLVIKVISSCNVQPTPSQGFRYVLETIACGYLMCKGFLIDPCEEDGVDSLENVSMEDREKLALLSTKYLQLISIEKIDDVLQLDKSLLTNKRYNPIDTNTSSNKKQKSRTTNDLSQEELHNLENPQDN